MFSLLKPKKGRLLNPGREKGRGVQRVFSETNNPLLVRNSEAQNTVG